MSLMPYLMPDKEVVLDREKKAVKRIFFLRQFGSLLCLLPLCNILRELGQSRDLIILVISALLWPSVALTSAVHSSSPLRIENRCRLAESMMAGCLIAMAGLSPVPSVVIIGVLVADRYEAGGWALLRQSASLFILSLLSYWFLNGHILVSGFSNLTVWLTLPLASLYIIALSVTSRQYKTESVARCLELESLSFSDPVLGLPNRRAFDKVIPKAFSKTQKGETCAYLMLIDIDYFKRMNDTFGHQAGDLLLTCVSTLLKETLQPGDIPARLGGDELAIIITDSDDYRVSALAQCIVDGVRALTVDDTFNHPNSVSIGIASALHSSCVTDWIRLADFALYEVKNRGKNGFKLATGDN